MFGWITGRQKSSLPEPTALQVQRSRQIEQLKCFNKNVSEIVRDLEYRINTVVGGVTISLYVTLPPLFPQDKPVVKISPRVNHSWVDNQMIVTGSPGLNNFMIHSDLGKVVKEIIDEFQSNPPTMLPQQTGYSGYYHTPTIGVVPPISSLDQRTEEGSRHHAARVSPYPSPSLSISEHSKYLQQTPVLGGMNTPAVCSQSPYLTPSATLMLASPYPMPGSTPQRTPSVQQSNGATSIFLSPPKLQDDSTVPSPGHYLMPIMPNHFPQLQDLSIQELGELADDDEKILQILTNLPELQQLNIDKEKFMHDNEESATQNLSLKPVLEEKRKLLLEKYASLHDLQKQFDEKAQHQEMLRQQFELSTIKNMLNIAAEKANEESENIAESFLAGKMKIDEFKSLYLEKRKLSHLRKAKQEKF